MGAAGTGFHIAQLNVGEPVGPPGSPELAEFEAMLDPINEIADNAPGFVWRLQDDEGNATSYRAFDSETMIVNMSVWESIETLRAFAYGLYADGAHKRMMRRRAEWFKPLEEEFLVLWWVPAGHLPDLGEAEQRLLMLRERGPTAEAFTFRRSFPPPGADGAAADS